MIMKKQAKKNRFGSPAASIHPTIGMLSLTGHEDCTKVNARIRHFTVCGPHKSGSRRILPEIVR